MKRGQPPVEWYAEKLERGEPFSSLLYGDGEFYVASGERTGDTMQYGETIRPGLQDEMRASLIEDGGPDVIRGTDLNLIDYENYRGNDKPLVRGIGHMIERTLAAAAPGRTFDWADGVVWEEAVQIGRLGPVIRALRRRDVVLVSNGRLRAGWLAGLPPYRAAVTVPDRNAAACLDRVYNDHPKHAGPWVTIVCMGLAAIPLIMRLRKARPEGTYLDLGSVLDVFAGIGAERRWREEMYRDHYRHLKVINDNLEG